MPTDDGRPARLPGAAPAALRQFVACEVDRVQLDLSEMGWIPKPPGLEDVPTPTVSVNEGWTPTSATISVGYGFISIELPATVVDGQLQIDTSNLSFGIDEEIDKWVDAFNRTLRGNQKQLDTFHVQGNQVVLTKRAIVPTADSGGQSVAPPGSPAPTPEPDSTPESSPSRKPPGGCMAWVLGGIVALAAAVGLTLAVSGDGDDDAVNGDGSPPVTDDSADAAADSETGDDGAAADTQEDEVGQVPDESAPDTRVCGTAPTDASGFVSGQYPALHDLGPCTPAPASYTNADCSPVLLPCATGPGPAFLLPGGGPGINHEESVPDALTGQMGLSKAEHGFYLNLFLSNPEAVARLTSDCGGNIVTGEALVSNGEVNLVEQPLLSFGPCTVVDGTLSGTADPSGAGFSRPLVEYIGFSYDVGPAEPDPVAPPVDDYVASSGRFSVPDDWATASLTVANTLGAGPIDDGCFWFFTPDNVELVTRVLDGCAQSDRFWVFAAGTTDVEVTLTAEDTVVGHAGGYLNPLGEAAPPILDTSAFATSGPLFDGTVFPCGFGDVGYTACPSGTAPVAAGAFVSVSAAMAGVVPLEGDGTVRAHNIDFGPSGGPAYVVAQDGEGWTVSSSAGDTRARAIIRDNSLTLVAPQNELPEGSLAYVWSTTVGGETVTQPQVPVLGIVTTPTILADGVELPPESTTDVGAPLETLDEFYAQLSASVTSGDPEFSLERLDPIVYDAYPTECPAALESFADSDFSIELVTEGETGPWMWELPDGRIFEVPDAITATVIVSGRGQSESESEAHVRLIDGRYSWFTFCA